MEEDLVATHPTDEEISLVIRDLMGPSSSSAVSKALHAYLSIGEQFYQDSQLLMEIISCFETQIRRPYFHVKPLDTNQLDNWHAYLNFAETYGDFDWVGKSLGFWFSLGFVLFLFTFEYFFILFYCRLLSFMRDAYYHALITLNSGSAMWILLKARVEGS